MKRTLKILTLLAVMAVGAGQQAWADNSNKNIRLSAASPEEAYLTGVEYVDATGTATTTAEGVKVYVLDGTEETLGATDTETWYVCNSDLTYTNTHMIGYVTSSITTYGKVNIIIADGKTLSVGTADEAVGGWGIEAMDDLCFYGQSAATGKIFVKSSNDCINVSSNTSYHSLTVTHCNIDATTSTGSGIYASEGITIMGCTDGSNTVKVNSKKDGIVSMAINITNCDIDVTSSNNYGLRAASRGGIIITGCADGSNTVKVNSKVTGIYADNETVITHCNVDVTSTNNSGIFSSNDVTVTGCTDISNTIKVNSYYQGIFGLKNVNISNCDVDITSTNDEGIYASSNITIDGGKVKVISQRDGEVGIYASNGNITLGWRKPGDFIQVSSYDCGDVMYGGGVMKTAANSGTGEETHVNRFEAFSVSGTGTEGDPFVETPFAYIEGDYTFTDDQITSLAGKKLVAAPEPLKYLVWDDTEKKLVETNTTDDNNPANDFLPVLQGTETTLGTAGEEMWYVALPAAQNGGYSLENYGQITLNGNVHLILADGAVMKATGEHGIYNNKDYDLTIYGQSEQSGSLTAVGNGSGNNGLYIENGDLVINGGNLTARSSNHDQCIFIYNGDITINGGNILLDKYLYVSMGNATINGGEVSGGQYSEIYANSGDITITGGNFSIEIIRAIGDATTGGHLTMTGGSIINGYSDVDVKGSVSNTVSGGQLNVWMLGYSSAPTTLSLNNGGDYIISENICGTLTIPRGNFLTDGENTYGSTDGDYTFGTDGHPAASTIENKTLVKATPIAATGKYLPFDSNDGDWLLGDGTVALYPTGLKFTEKDDGSYKAEVILSDKPLAGILQGKAVILTNKTVGADLGPIWLMGSNANSGEGKTPDDIKNDYNGRTDRLANFVAADGTKTIAQLMADAASLPEGTAADPSEYIVFVLRGDTFCAVSTSPDAVPQAGTTLLIVPKWNLLRHINLEANPGSGGSSARRITLGDGETTGIVSLTSDGNDTDAPWYTLDGRKISTVPTHKGVFIRNGQKVVIK